MLALDLGRFLVVGSSQGDNAVVGMRMQKRHADVVNGLQGLSERAQSPSLLSAGLRNAAHFCHGAGGPDVAGQGYRVRTGGLDALEWVDEDQWCEEAEARERSMGGGYNAML